MTKMVIILIECRMLAASLSIFSLVAAASTKNSTRQNWAQNVNKYLHQKYLPKANGDQYFPKICPKNRLVPKHLCENPTQICVKKRPTKSNLECVGLFPPNRAKNILNRVMSIVKIQHICKYTKYFDERVEGIFSSKGYSNSGKMSRPVNTNNPLSSYPNHKQHRKQLFCTTNEKYKWGFTTSVSFCKGSLPGVSISSSQC